MVRMGSLFVPIVALESHRQTRYWARRGLDVFLILSQLVSGAVSIPLYFAVISYYDGIQDQAARPKTPRVRTDQAWTVLLSTIVGYALPLLYGVRTGWSNAAITTFLCLPIYLIALNKVLPPILRKSSFLQSLPASLPVTLTAALSALLAANGHLGLLFSGIPFKYIFWPFSNPPSLTRDLQILLVHDYLFVIVEMASFVVLYLQKEKSTKQKLQLVVEMIAQSALFGPTASIAWIWARAELERDSRRDDGAGRAADSSQAAERQRLFVSDNERR